MPHKIWAVGEEVLAADFQTYLQNQTVPQFPNVAARDTWAAPPKSALCVTQDTNTLWQFSGARWNAIGGNTAMRVYRSTVQSIPHQALTALTFDQERYDPDALHTGVLGRFTVFTGGEGLYDIGACVEFATSGVGSRQVILRVNGTDQIANVTIPSVTSAGIRPCITVNTHYRLAAAAYVEVMVWQDSGAALNIAATPNYSPEFWATRIGL